jgi:hypothetical protein
VGVVPAAKAVPSAVSCRDHRRVGVLPTTPSDFQIRYGVPVAGSMKGSGSIEPAGSASHTSGPLLRSTNGPSGELEVAREMQ